MKFSRGLALVPCSVLLFAACGDDSSTAGAGGAGGDGATSTVTSSTSSTAIASSTAATTSTSSQASSSGDGTGGTGGNGTGGDPSGTGGDPSGTGGAGVGGAEPICDFEPPSNERTDACASYAASLCGFYGDCYPGLSLLFGADVDTCIAVTMPSCALQENVVEAKLFDCLDALTALYQGLSCEDGVSGVASPDACVGVGRLANGQPCQNALECAGGVCEGAGAGDCATCDAVRARGDACDDDAYCAGALSCVAGECADPAPDGSECDSARDCQGSACANGECATAIIASEGEDCGGLRLCDLTQELRCDIDSGECVGNPIPAPGALGEDCVPYSIDLGGFVFPVDLCEAGSTCDAKTCVEAALPGESCAGDVACLSSTCESDTCAAADPNLCACPQ